MTNLKNIQTEIIFVHNLIDKDCYILRGDSEVSYCELDTKKIFFFNEDWDNPTNETIFTLLHEIGHIKTNTKEMKRCEEEFYATDWAIKEFKKLNLSLSKNRQREYQEYIYKYRNYAEKRKCKNIPTIEEMTLNW